MDTSQQQTPSPHRAAPTRLVISREFQILAGMRALRVLLDGAPVGTVGSGDQMVLEVTPGPHQVSVELTTIGTMRGHCALTISPGETRHVRASFEMGLLKNRLMLLEHPYL